MKTKEIKEIVKKITGFDYISVRKGTGSMSGRILIFCSCNNKITFKPFENELRSIFDVDIFGWDVITLKYQI